MAASHGAGPVAAPVCAQSGLSQVHGKVFARHGPESLVSLWLPVLPRVGFRRQPRTITAPLATEVSGFLTCSASARKCRTSGIYEKRAAPRGTFSRNLRAEDLRELVERKITCQTRRTPGGIQILSP
ncbi:hypothetical protein DFH08DRAFT_796858 [Mycena albidolilacea]|uniref:Uncharacterized protein n=1 Tax=Mycena albidolilacea TaxID=1033008 RepID=A0AAD7AVZ4_9AGAR|nr:hypothetical protein DFH08DRAFT_796858 [Mycena albidolilacea]